MVEHARRPMDQGGFSLVELLVVMVIAGVLGSAVVTAVVSTGRAERVALDLRENTDVARLATERLRDEIRTAWGVCDSSDATVLTVWWQDENGNARIDPDELRTYDIASGELRRTAGGGPPQLLAAGLGAGSGFSYYDRSGVEVAPPVDGRGVDCASTEVVVGRGDIATVGVSLAGDLGGDRVDATRVDMQITLRNAAVADGTVNPNRPPLASFTQSCSGLVCTFDASGSHDEDGDIVSFAWSFGDGTNASGMTVTKTFPSVMSWPVVLTVTDDGGASDSLTQFVDLDVDNAIPSATFTVACAGMTCTFDPSGTFHSSGTIASFSWEFGDGGSQVTATSIAVDHTYVDPGALTVTLTVIDTEGRFGTETQTANPTSDATGVVLTLVDESYEHNKHDWYAKVGITARYLDGTPVVGLEVRGRFGPSDSALGQLETRSTNAQGVVSLQADGRLSSSTYYFQVESISTYDVAPSSQTSIILTQPE